MKQDTEQAHYAAIKAWQTARQTAEWAMDMKKRTGLFLPPSVEIHEPAIIAWENAVEAHEALGEDEWMNAMEVSEGLATAKPTSPESWNHVADAWQQAASAWQRVGEHWQQVIATQQNETAP